jgi:hypothetical protein
VTFLDTTMTYGLTWYGELTLNGVWIPVPADGVWENVCLQTPNVVYAISPGSSSESIELDCGDIGIFTSGTTDTDSYGIWLDDGNASIPGCTDSIASNYDIL